MPHEGSSDHADGGSMSDVDDASLNLERAVKQLEHLGIFADQMPCGMSVLGPHGEIVRVNEAMVAVIGLDFRDSYRKLIRDVDPEMWSRLEGTIARVMLGERVSNQLVYEISSAPRTEVRGAELVSSVLRQTRRCQFEYFPLRVDQEVVGVGVLAFDLSEHDDLRNQNRELASRSHVLQEVTNACVRYDNAQDFYEALAEIVVSISDVDMTWIGIRDNGTIRKGPSRGIDDGYVLNLVVSATEGDPYAQGPLGRAFFTGNTVVLRDFQAAPFTEPWHDEATRAGFRSSAAIPLKSRGEVVAVLSVYSRTVNGLSEATIETLDGLRSLVTLGLEHFETLQRDSITRDSLMMRDGALGTISQGIAIADATVDDLPLIYVSPSFSVLTGYTSAEILGRNCRFLQGPETNPDTVEAIRRAIALGQGIEVEILNYTKSGEAFWNHLAMSPVFDDQGKLTRYVGVQSDISEQRRLQSQLIQSQRLEAIGTLAGGIAHDFNNLLLVMQGYTSLLLRELKDQRHHDVAQRIQDAVARGADFTRHLLAYSRQQVNSPRVEDLTTLVRGALTLLTGVIGSDITLMTDFEENPATIYLDPSQFEQIMINLITNARDAMSEGGTLVVRTKSVAVEERITVSQSEMEPGRYVMLEVTDTGAGMSKAVLDRVFEPFYTTKVLGTGLGLASVIGIVKQNLGFISADSEEGIGSTFKVYFPVAVAASGPENPSRLSPSSSNHASRTLDDDEDAEVRGTETILVVEDDEEVRHLVVNALGELGYLVIEATSGRGGLELSRTVTGRIDVLLTDVIMPEMNGRELAELLVIDRPELRVIFTSGYPSNVLHDRDLLDEKTIFIEKPYSSRVIARAIRSLLDP